MAKLNKSKVIAALCKRYGFTVKHFNSLPFADRFYYYSKYYDDCIKELVEEVIKHYDK